jgi:DNA repair protein SbcD/Mre11
MSIRILATADLHIGRTSSNSGEKGATRDTWKRLVDYTIAENVDVLVIAGDIVEHANRYFEAASALESGLTQLDSAGVSVMIVAGNHDYDVLPSILKDHDFKNVKLLGENGEWKLEKLAVNGLELQFAGWSFPNMHVRNDPLVDFPDDSVDPNAICIGLIHGDYGNKESIYAPIQYSTMTGKGVDVWVMGHIHKPETFNQNTPLIYYPGSPQALSPKEKGKHGAVLMTIGGKGDIVTEVIPFSSIRYDELKIDITECESEDEIRAKIIEFSDVYINDQIEVNDFLELLNLDVNLIGGHSNIKELESSINGWDINELQRNVDGLRVTLRKVSHNCRAKIGDLKNLSNEPSPAGLLAQAILELEEGNSSDFIEAMKKESKASIKNLNAHSTYLPIRDSDNAEPIDESEIDVLLLQECNRLLSELIQTKKR